MALPKVKEDALEARLAETGLPQGGGWARTAREGALARLRAMGLPHRRDEYWKFTRPDTLVEPGAPPAAVLGTENGEGDPA